METTELTKRCNTCGRVKTVDEFYRQKRGKYGRNSKCKICNNKATYEYRTGEKSKDKYLEMRREYYKKNKEGINEYQKQRRRDNPEKTAEDRRRYYTGHKDHINEIRRQNYQENDEAREKINERNRQSYQENREKLIEYQRKYRAENKELVNAKDRKRYQENIEVRKEYNRRYRQSPEGKEAYRRGKHSYAARKKDLSATLTPYLWGLIIELWDYRCAYCETPEDELEENLHQEHVLAVDNGGEYSEFNVVPGCKSCNSSKSDSDVKEWMKRKGYDYKSFARSFAYQRRYIEEVLRELDG